jgi:hypothetical protein
MLNLLVYNKKKYPLFVEELDAPFLGWRQKYMEFYTKMYEI